MADFRALALFRTMNSESLTSFLAALSHEIRTPLNGMMAAFQMLRETDDHQERERLLNMGEGAGMKLLRLIERSIDLDVLDTGAGVLNPQVIDLREWLDDFEQSIRLLVPWQEIDLRSSVSAVVPGWVLMDSIRLRQILGSMMENALRFTPKEIIFFEIDAGKLLENGKRSIRFSVTDSGVGISGDIIDESFTSDPTHKSRSSGLLSGLGLVVAKELVALMGGRIEVRASSGIGWESVVEIPLEEVDKPVAVKPVATAALPQFEGRVLLVEDDEASGALAQLMLERLGLKVDLTTDGGQALEIAAARRYDLIFMDCWMPVAGGIEVTRKLRSSSEMACWKTPIVALTGNATKAEAAECAEAGMNDFMSKPILFGDLIATLHKFLPAVPHARFT